MSLTLEIPADYEGALDLSTSNAPISAKDIRANAIELRSSNARLELAGVNVGGNVSLSSLQRLAEGEKTARWAGRSPWIPLTAR